MFGLKLFPMFADIDLLCIENSILIKGKKEISEFVATFNGRQETSRQNIFVVYDSRISHYNSFGLRQRLGVE